MKRVSLNLVGAVALSFAVTDVAGAQVPNVPMGPTLGTSGDSSRISNSNRENNAEYNRLIGASDAKSAVKTDDNAKPAHKTGPATAADIKAGAPLRDVKGVAIGTIVSVDANQAVVDYGNGKIGVPLMGLGKDDKGLLLNITADQFKAAIAKAHARAQAQAQAQSPDSH